MADNALVLAALIMVAGFLYSFVGHGGASGYLMVMSVVGGISTTVMASTALMLNVVVASVGLVSWYRVGALRRQPTLMLIAASVPFAFLGGTLRISGTLYDLLLSIVLIAVGVDLLLHASRRLVQEEQPQLPAAEPGAHSHVAVSAHAMTARAAVPLGGGIGLLSGMIGIGGGVILSPALVHGRWLVARSVAATSAAFILANSLAGIGGRIATDSLDTGWMLWLVPFAAVAGIAGSRLGSRHAAPVLLVRMLAVVVLIAGLSRSWELVAAAVA